VTKEILTISIILFKMCQTRIIIIRFIPTNIHVTGFELSRSRSTADGSDLSGIALGRAWICAFCELLECEYCERHRSTKSIFPDNRFVLLRFGVFSGDPLMGTHGRWPCVSNSCLNVQQNTLKSTNYPIKVNIGGGKRPHSLYDNARLDQLAEYASTDGRRERRTQLDQSYYIWVWFGVLCGDPAQSLWQRSTQSVRDIWDCW